MSETAETSIDLLAILRDEAVLPHFQPLVSTQRRSIVGFEGLSRGWDEQRKTLIPAPLLFGSADRQGLKRELDLLCRKKILGEFGQLLAVDPDFILSINIDAHSSIEGQHWSGYLKEQVSEAGLSPRNVVIEILESAIEDVGELLRFVGMYRDAGYLIAMDDVGAGHSNLNRIPLVQPDIIKIDRYLVEDVDKDFYKQEVFKSLLSMARHLGTVIIAEGVETEQELDTLMDLGVDIIQGFIFGKPRRVADLDLKNVGAGIMKVGAGFRERHMFNASRKRGNMALHQDLSMKLRAVLAERTPEEFPGLLMSAVGNQPGLECLYLIDESGRQVTEMFFNAGRTAHRSSSMFRPLGVGADHSLRDYFYFLADPGFARSLFVTKPHVSMNSGNLCVTIASKFQNPHVGRLILCMDVKTL